MDSCAAKYEYQTGKITFMVKLFKKIILFYPNLWARGARLIEALRH